MASLEKIQICGIRSFGPEQEDVQTIKFEKPLTLILGENGCGKSTIIECLRYLTAQKEPGGKGTFVHDPSLTGRTSVKGFVKLKISDGKGNRIDLCRQMQATRTKKTLTTKTLDNVISRTNRATKEKNSVSNRCADFSYEISRIFGVSRAILENVIFCTQEDSHWPLDTDQKLKEKFDQIFDSDRYNKCITEVKSAVKGVKEKHKVAQVEIKYLEGNKKMAEDKRKEIERTKNQVNDCEREIEELNSQLEPIDLQLKRVSEKELEMSKNHTLKETKKAELKQLDMNIANLKKSIRHEFTGTDEELENAKKILSKQLENYDVEKSKLQEKEKEWIRQEQKLSQDLMTEQGKLGQLQKEEEINKEKMNERNQNLNKLAVQLEIDSNELSQGSEDSVDYLLSRVQLVMNNREETITTLKKENAQRESEMQISIDKLREALMGLQNDVSNKEKDIKSSGMEMTKIRKDLNEIDQSTSKLSEIEMKMTKTDKALSDLMKFDAEKVKGDIQKTLSERNQMEDRLVKVEETIKVLQQNAAACAELEVQKELRSNKDSDIRRLMNKHEESLKSILGDVPSSGFKIAVQGQIEKFRRTAKELTNAQTRKEKELTELEVKRKHHKDQLRSEEEKLRSYEEEIYEVCGSDEFDDVVTSLQSQIDDLQDVKGTLSSSEYMYQRYIRALKKPKPCCPLCHRDFQSQNDATILVDELESKIQEVPSKLVENKSKLEEKQERFNKLLALRSKHNQIVTLKSETIPALRTDLEKTETSLKKIRRELDDVAGKLLPIQTDEAIASSMLGDMALLDQLQVEKKKIGWEIDKLESRVDDSGVSLDDMFKEQGTLRERLKTARSRLEELQSKLNEHNEEMQSWQGKKNRLMEEINKIQGDSRRKKQLKERYEELQTLEVVHTEELNLLRNKQEEAKKALNEAMSKHSALKSKGSSEVDERVQALSGFQQQLNRIQAANDHVKTYERRGVAKRLESARVLMQKLESDLANVKAERDKLRKAIGDLGGDASSYETRHRELEDNVNYRRSLKRADELRAEVVTLERKCGDTNFDAILREKRKLKDDEDRIGRKKAVIQGRLGELAVRIEMLENELSGKMLKDVETNYSKELAKVVTLKALASDLEKYATGMEYAMMTYHKEKMKRVNSFIREFWRRVYQGNDIDYIEIQTEALATSEKRRNYAYKVIQRKDETYMDMRNRCSAGQKMLASLIIRMALAETFSSNCGILTLDEPTTNLDRKNIRNLARMLASIIEAKEAVSNGNFQLIVITHDEEFLRELMSFHDINTYVRVGRNDVGRTRVRMQTFDGTTPRMTDSNSRVGTYD